MKFRSTVELGGTTATGIPVPETVFDGLSYSKKQRLVIPIEQAKTVETRRRRIDKAVDTLHEGRI